MGLYFNFKFIDKAWAMVMLYSKILKAFMYTSVIFKISGKKKMFAILYSLVIIINTDFKLIFMTFKYKVRL